MTKETVIDFEGKTLALKNLNKFFWPEEGLTKAHLLKYYSEMSSYVLPYIKNRPLVMKRYPDGIKGDSFYQKDCPTYAPAWVDTIPVKHTDKKVDYIICNDTATLVWLAAQGCIEIHAWLSTKEKLDFPDLAVMDLDPAEGVSFSEVGRVAMLVKETLEYFQLHPFIKTSGASGLHIFVPVYPEYSFDVVVACMKYIAELIVASYPERCTVERKVDKRSGKVYLDYLQNGRGKTMAFPYSLRPLPGAPVSTPLQWQEVPGLSDPAVYNINTILTRLSDIGDPWQNIATYRRSLQPLVKVAP